MKHDNSAHKKMMEERIKPPNLKGKVSSAQKKKKKQEKEDIAKIKKRLDNKYLDKHKNKKTNKLSKEQEKKVWEAKRKQWYNEKVWKGWRESEPPSEIKVYSIKDIKNE
ncbi:hypothetical protein [Cytobacillus oceanisediminis]|uniref:hypothetical protein n=1 Tax=Cytobacillus oceanisediminis TaxID=665099 RepID=UPI001C227CE6|nr:hypothetical protein [Cytobacillus oceanisediminis]MBU8770345.1 hypothetical protein [Cytobacillus oceanisediminis]